MSQLTAEQFAADCGARIRAAQVTDAMLQQATQLSKADAVRLDAMPGSGWSADPVFQELNAALGSPRDRVIQAVLTVAQKWGANA